MIRRLAAAAIALLLAAPAVATAGLKTGATRSDAFAAAVDDEQATKPATASKPAEPTRVNTAKGAEPAQAADTAKAVPRHVSQAVNVRIDVTITEQQSAGTPTKKTVTLVVADDENGSARALATVQRQGVKELPLNVDARPQIVDDHRVRVRLVLNWRVLSQKDAAESPSTSDVTEMVTAILDSGKPLIVAQSADPVSDRQVTVEVRATILR